MKTSEERAQIVSTLAASSPEDQLRLLDAASTDRDEETFRAIFSALPFATKNYIFAETGQYGALRQSPLLRQEIIRAVEEDQASDLFTGNQLRSKKPPAISACIEHLQLARRCLGDDEFSALVYSDQQSFFYLLKMCYYCIEFATDDETKLLGKQLLARVNYEGLMEMGLQLTSSDEQILEMGGYHDVASTRLSLSSKVQSTPLFREINTHFIAQIKAMDAEQFIGFIRNAKSWVLLTHPDVFNKVCDSAASSGVMRAWLDRQLALGPALPFALQKETRDGRSRLALLLEAPNRVEEWKALADEWKSSSDPSPLMLAITLGARTQQSLIPQIKGLMGSGLYIKTLLAGGRGDEAAHFLPLLVEELSNLSKESPDFDQWKHLLATDDDLIAVIQREVIDDNALILIVQDLMGMDDPRFTEIMRAAMQGISQRGDFRLLSDIVNKVCSSPGKGENYAALLYELESCCVTLGQTGLQSQLRPHLIQALEIEQLDTRYRAESTAPDIAPEYCFSNIMGYFEARVDEAMRKGGLESSDGRRYTARLDNYIELHKLIRAHLDESDIGTAIKPALDASLATLLQGWAGTLWSSKRYEGLASALTSIPTATLRRRFEEMEARIALLGCDENSPHPFREMYTRLELGARAQSRTPAEEAPASTTTTTARKQT